MMRQHSKMTRLRYKRLPAVHRNPAQVIICLILLLASLAGAGCGYRFAGGGKFPGNVHRLFVDMLENRTAETGIENTFTNDLIYEITRRKKVVLTGADRAEAVLSGTIKALTIETISHRGTMTSLERRVTVTVDLGLVKPDGETVWSARNVAENEEYAVSADKSTTEQNRRNAILALSKRLAENIYRRLTEDF